jgi:hypothetical protein
MFLPQIDIFGSSPGAILHLEFFTPGNIGKAGQNELPQIVAVMRARGKLYSSPAGSLPKSRQLAAKSQSYLNSYRIHRLPKINLGSKTGKKVDLFLIFVLNAL